MQITNENIKYCLLTWDRFEKQHIDSFATQDMCVSGLYNWSKVFNGDRFFPRTSEDFDKYNVIHLNVTSKNLPLIAKIYPKINHNKTKLVLNIDYAFELWNSNFQSQHYFLQEIDKADHIFAVEPCMAEILSEALHRNVPCIPHPSPIDQIKKYTTKERDFKILCSIHKYDMNYLFPWYCIRDLDPKWVSSCIGAYTALDKVLPYYDNPQEYCKFDTLVEYIAKHYMCIESYTIHSYGRLSVECAALGVPCIGSKFVYSIQKCFPELCIENNSILSAKKLINLLIDDKAFYSEVAKKAIEESEYFSFDNCKKLMLDFLNS